MLTLWNREQTCISMSALSLCVRWCYHWTVAQSIAVPSLRVTSILQFITVHKDLQGKKVSVVSPILLLYLAVSTACTCLDLYLPALCPRHHRSWLESSTRLGRFIARAISKLVSMTEQLQPNIANANIPAWQLDVHCDIGRRFPSCEWSQSLCWLNRVQKRAVVTWCKQFEIMGFRAGRCIVSESACQLGLGHIYPNWIDTHVLFLQYFNLSCLFSSCAGHAWTDKKFNMQGCLKDDFTCRKEG